MHEAGERYLDRLVDETTQAYKARLRRSDFFNATWRTIAGLSGMAFRKPPQVSVPSAIQPYLADINMAGRSINDMSKAMVEDKLEYGAFGLMVDHPPAPENVRAMSVAAAEAQGLRPLIQYYEIESVINWRYARINNRQTLVMVVLKEEADVSTDQFGHDCEDRYRVLDLVPNAQGQWTYRQRLFKVEEIGGQKVDVQIGDDIFPMINGRLLSEIPFRIVGELDEPPLIDLVDANVAHYQVNSDYRHGLHFTGLPTLFLAGVTMPDNQNFYIGSTAAIATPDANAKAEFIEFTGQGLEPSEKALARLEQRMAILGARMIADESKQVETLGATVIKRAGENSILASIAGEVSDAVEWALGIFAEWIGASGEIVYQINRDYGTAGLSAQDLTALVGAVQAGKISDRELFDLLQRHDVIGGAVTFEEHQAEVDMQALPSPVGVAA